MGVREILEFVKVEHTLFSLPFVLIGFMLADHSFGSETMDIIWIVLAAVGARGLAMALNRIVDRDIDADNPRTASRHLPSGTMSIGTAWILAVVFLSTLLFSAWRLNKVALMMSWLPVLAFAIYPYTKRFSWICHFWIGLCLALAPAGAWLAIAADTHGWESITGLIGTESRFLWFPEVFFISLGVALWIATFDINYALMDVEIDRKQGIYSFPSTFGEDATRKLSVFLTLCWMLCFLLTGMHEFTDSRNFRSKLWAPSVVLMSAVNVFVVNNISRRSSESSKAMEDFQKLLFRSSMLTGWVLLFSIGFVEFSNEN